ncbi:MAG: glycosyltransferase, partial [Pseudomonadota bacterium]
ILLLGRFEEQGYKNSPEAFNILRRVQKEVPDVRLLVLAGSESIDVPGDLKSKVVFLPTISDACLAEISKRSALGLSMSLWEGFNLPLAEMQWFDRPALVFNVGAHPEVAADPWLLCETSEEMGRKAVRLLQDESGLRLALAESMDRFRARFRWNGTLSRWVATILQDPSVSPAVPPGKLRRLVLVDVTNSSRDPANSGVIRVTRRLSRELSARPELEVWFVAWDPARDGGRGGFRLLGQTERQFLASNGGPTDVKGVAFERLISSAEELLSTAGHVSTASPIFLFPEIALDGSAFARNEWASRQGCRIANVFYDMIPIYQSEYVDHTVRGAFPDYLRSISKADAVWSISGFSQSEFERYANEQSLAIPQRCEALLLPGQFSDRSRVKGQSEQDLSGTSVNILCVATIEPRKNHIALLDAFNKLRDIAPELSVHLHLVGNSYVNADSLTARVLDAASNDDQITWHKILPDATLSELYESASFTVYPSLTEGFGLPIMESLWIGRPCICHNSGVMAELAAGGGCLTVDMTSALALAQSMKKLAEDPALRAKLAQEAQARAISTWGDYAEEITRRICDL